LLFLALVNISNTHAVVLTRFVNIISRLCKLKCTYERLRYVHKWSAVSVNCNFYLRYWVLSQWGQQCRKILSGRHHMDQRFAHMYYIRYVFKQL